MFSQAFCILLLSTSALAFFWDTSSDDTSEYFYHQCHAKCSAVGQALEGPVRECCQSVGFTTGYCTPYGTARCHGRTAYGVRYLDGTGTRSQMNGGPRNEAQAAQYVDAAYQRAKEVVRAYEAGRPANGAGAEVPLGNAANGQAATGRRRRSYSH